MSIRAINMWHAAVVGWGIGFTPAAVAWLYVWSCVRGHEELKDALSNGPIIFILAIVFTIGCLLWACPWWALTTAWSYRHRTSYVVPKYELFSELMYGDF